MRSCVHQEHCGQWRQRAHTECLHPSPHPTCTFSTACRRHGRGAPCNAAPVSPMLLPPALHLLDSDDEQASERLHIIQPLTGVDPDAAGTQQPASTNSQLQPWPCTTQVLDDVVTMFHTLPYEYDYWVDQAWVTGTIPKELRGTYWKNGAGLQIGTGKHQRHFLDGDGCVLALAFPGDGAPPHFTNRYVRTKGFVDEQAAGKPLYRNAFTRGAVDGGRLFNPLDLNFKNVANTGVLYWAGRMWALWEVGRPYELCPRSLATLGESSMDDQISQRLAGHYRIVTQPDGSKRAILFGAQVSFSGMSLEFYEMDEQGKVVAKAQHKLQKGLDIMFVHDMLVTEHWYVIIMGPVKLDLAGFVTDYLMSKRSLAELLLYVKDKPSQVFLYPRPGVTPPAAAGPLQKHVLQAPPFFCFHHINAYERAGGAEVVMDTISWQNIAFGITQYTINQSYYQGGCRSELYRLVAHLPSSTLTTCQQLLRRTVEFPAYNTNAVTGRPYRYAYCTADAVDNSVAWAPAQALLKVTLPLEGAEEDDQQQQQGKQAQQQHVPVRVPGQVLANNIVPTGRGTARHRRSSHVVVKSSHDNSSSSSSNNSSVGSHHASHHTVNSRGHSVAHLPTSPQEHVRFATAAHSRVTIATTSTSTTDISAGSSVLNSASAQTTTRAHASTSTPTARFKGRQGGPEQVREATTLPAAVAAAPGVVCEEWRPGQRSFPQEPMFVARPGAIAEDDGWLIVFVHNAETMRAEVAILDAQRVSAGPVATIHLPHPLWFGLHGAWTHDYLGPDPHDTTAPRWREPARIREL